MDNQQEQQNQNLKQNQPTEQDSEWDNAEPELNFGEAIEETEEVTIAQEIEQKEAVADDKPKKTRRPRKTIEQELAELDAKRQRLMEKKRSQDAHEKIVFGSTVIAMLKEMKEKNDSYCLVICNLIKSFVKEIPKNDKIIKKIVDEIESK